MGDMLKFRGTVKVQIDDMGDMRYFRRTAKVWVSDMGDMWIVEFLDVKSELR